MEEKKINEEQAAGQTTSQENMNELDILKTENEELKKKVEYQRDTNCKEYRKVEILKGALKILKEKYSISDGDYYSALLSGGNGELDIDTILYQLSK